MKRAFWLSGLLAVLLGVFFFLRSCDRRIDVQTGSKTLAPGVVEKIIFNPSTHRLSIVKPEGVQDMFLPDRPSSIEINKFGKAVVTSRQQGTELKPFVGFQFSNAGRIAFGVDLLYFKKLDLGVGVAGQIGNHTPIAFSKLSYTVWSNTQVGLTYGTENHLGGIVTVRF